MVLFFGQVELDGGLLLEVCSLSLLSHILVEQGNLHHAFGRPRRWYLWVTSPRIDLLSDDVSGKGALLLFPTSSDLEVNKDEVIVQLTTREVAREEKAVAIAWAGGPERDDKKDCRGEAHCKAVVESIGCYWFIIVRFCQLQ